MSAPDTAVTVLGPDDVGIGKFDDGARINATSLQRVDELAVRRARRAAERINDYRHRNAHYIRVLLACDGVAAALAIGAATWLPGLRGNGIAYWVGICAIAVVIWPAVIAAIRGYHRHQIGGVGANRTVLTAMATIVVVAAVPAGWFGVQPMVRLIAVAAPIAAVGSVLGRAGVGHLRRRDHRSGVALRQVILVGTSSSVAELHQAIAREPRAGFEVIGVCVPAEDLADAQALELPVVGDLDQVATVAGEMNCHAVMAAGTTGEQPGFLRRLSWSLEGTEVEVLVNSGLTDVTGSRTHIESYNGLTLLQVDQPHFTGWRRTAKRVLDVTLTSVGLLIIWPLLAIVAAAVKLEDRRGPVFFKQTRIGIDGTTFTMYKFRSMVVDAEKRLADLAPKNEGAGPLFKMEHDPRVTRVGAFIRKYSIDELPQLFNVLIGNMSLVGPRPPLQSEVDEYATDTHRRLKVVPGLTGLWQVSGRSLLSWEESVRLDLKYVENWSVALDLQILFKTAHAVLAQRGAY